MGMDELILEHHGVKGQKWGVRRTPAQLGHKTSGKRRSIALSVKNKSKAKKAIKQVTKKKNVKPSAKSMTDDELRQAIQRIQLEQQYNRLTPQTKSLGKRFVESAMKDVIGPAVREGSKEVVKKALVSTALKQLGIQDDQKKKKKDDD